MVISTVSNKPCFENKDRQAIRGLIFDKLKKISLTEDLTLVNSALRALINHQTPDSNLSPTLSSRIQMIQEIIDDPSMWGIPAHKYKAFHQIIFDCLNEEIIYFIEKQKQLIQMTQEFEKQMFSKIEKELIWLAPEKLGRVGEAIKNEALKQARLELSKEQRIDEEKGLTSNKDLENKKKELGSRIPSTEKFHESVRRQLEEGRIGARWTMESLFGHESVVTHYLVQDQILCKEDYLNLTVYEFVQFGSDWLKPIYSRFKEPPKEPFTTQKIKYIVYSEPKFQRLKKIQHFKGKLEELAELLKGYEGDRDVILEAIKRDGKILKYAHEKFREDREIVLEAVKTDGSALKYVHEKFREDREVVLAAVKSEGIALKYAHKKFREDREVVLEAIIQDEIALQYASDELKDDRELILKVIDQKGLILEFVSDRLKNDRELVIRAVNQDGWALEFASDELKNDRTVVLTAVRHHGWALQYASNTLRSDKKIVSAAVEQDGSALEFASKKLRQNRKIVLKAIKQKGEALEFASKMLRNDLELVLIALEQNGLAYRYLSKNFKSDRNIILKALQQNGFALGLLKKDLRNDRELVLEAVRQNGEALKYASDALKKDRELVLEAIRQNGRAYEYVDEELKLDNDVLIALELYSFAG